MSAGALPAWAEDADFVRTALDSRSLTREERLAVLCSLLVLEIVEGPPGDIVRAESLVVRNLRAAIDGTMQRAAWDAAGGDAAAGRA
jgi:hypothetical protein